MVAKYAGTGKENKGTKGKKNFIESAC